MTQTIASPDPLLVNIVFITLAIGLPMVIVLLVRFLWDRNLQLGRSKELEKLIWQLHRIATALEHQMNLSFPAVQPGSEEPHDVAFLKPLATHANPAHSVAAPSASVPATVQPLPQPTTPEPVSQQQPSIPAPVLQEPSANELPRRAGVNSMFGL
jgi:hypothetical protein